MSAEALPAVPDSGRAFGREGLAVLALIAALFFLCLPIISDVSLYHSDERYYTDSAVRMEKTGDWTTPWYLGQPRLKKPMLSYWLIAASYELLEVSFLTSRLPFLLLGCLLVWLTWRTALALLGDRGIALTSAAVLVSLWPMTALACRSTPDIEITTFTMMAMYGFARVLLAGDASLGATAWAWGGAGLAVASKGGLGLMVPIWTLAFGVLHPLSRSRMKALFRPPGFLLGAVVALAGFSWMFVGSAKGSPAAMLDDQVATKLARSLPEVGDNLSVYLSCILRHFLPWTVLVMLVWARDRRSLAPFVRETRAAHAFGLGWSALVVLVFSLANTQRARYLAPAYPMIVIFVAAWLVQTARRGRSANLVRMTLSALLCLMTIVGVLAACVGGRIDARFAVGGVLIAAVAAGSWWASRRLPDVARLAVAGGALLVCGVAQEKLIRSVLAPSPAPRIADALARLEGGRFASIGMDHRYSSQVLVLTAGEVEMESLPEEAAAPDLEPFSAVVVPKRLAGRLQPGRYRLEECGFEYAMFGARDVWELMTSPRPAEVLARRKMPFYVAVRSGSG